MATVPPSLRHWAVAALTCCAGACGGGETPPILPTGPTPVTGRLSVILDKRGEGDDADGVTVSLWAGSLVATRPAQLGDTVAFGEVSVGAYTVSVAGLDPMCRGDIADVVDVKAQPNVLRLQTECAGRILYEKEFSATRVAVLYVGADSRLRTLSLPGLQRVRDLSPDGERALVEEWQSATCGTRIHTAVVTLEGGVVPLQQNPRRPVTVGATWSPAGDLIAGREEGTPACGDSDGRAIVLYSPATGAVTRTVVDATAQTLGPDVAWTPDGTRLTYVNGSTVLAYSVVSGALAQLYTAADGERPQDLSWAPGGRYLLFRPTPQAGLRMLDVSNGSVTDVPVPGATAAAWHPSGNLVAVEGTGAGGVFVFDVRDRSVTAAAADAVAEAHHPSWNVDGDRLLLSGRSSSGARALFVVDWPARSVWRVLEGDVGGPLRARWTRGSSGR